MLKLVEYSVEETRKYLEGIDMMLTPTNHLFPTETNSLLLQPDHVEMDDGQQIKNGAII